MIENRVYQKVGIGPGEKLPAFAWPGGTPILYFDNEGTFLCSDCANCSESDIVDASPWEVDVGYGEMTCEECSHIISGAWDVILEEEKEFYCECVNCKSYRAEHTTHKCVKCGNNVLSITEDGSCYVCWQNKRREEKSEH